MRSATIAAMLIAAGPACGQAAPDGAALSLSGRLAHARVFSGADLARLPVVGSDPGVPGPHWSGVALWPLLDQAGWVDQPGRKTHWQHVILARGRDGYTVALSIAELDPALEGKQVLVGMARDGTKLSELQLIIPGDKKQARHVHDLVAIEVQ